MCCASFFVVLGLPVWRTVLYGREQQCKNSALSQFIMVVLWVCNGCVEDMLVEGTKKGLSHDNVYCCLQDYERTG
jgi:hypothetical protein